VQNSEKKKPSSTFRTPLYMSNEWSNFDLNRIVGLRTHRATQARIYSLCRLKNQQHQSQRHFGELFPVRVWPIFHISQGDYCLSSKPCSVQNIVLEDPSPSNAWTLTYLPRKSHDTSCTGYGRSRSRWRSLRCSRRRRVLLRCRRYCRSHSGGLVRCSGATCSCSARYSPAEWCLH